MLLLSGQIDQIRNACRSNQVKSLFAFGSVTTGRFHEASDVDLVVEIAESDPLVYSDRYFNLKEQLRTILQRPVDLLELNAIRNPVLRREIDKTKVLIYGA